MGLRELWAVWSSGRHAQLKMPRGRVLSQITLLLSLKLTSHESGRVSVRLADDGSFDAVFPAGTYIVTLVPCGYLGCSSIFPVTVTLDAGTVTSESFSIDSGIR